MTQAGGALLAASIVIKNILKIAQPVLVKMKAVRTRIEATMAAATAEHDAHLARNKTDLREAEVLVGAAQQDLAASAAKLVSAVEDFYGSTGTGRLQKFLRARATDGHYAKHLGLVASVRKDFEELSAGMRDAGPRTATPREIVQIRERLRVLLNDDSPLLPDDKLQLQDLEKKLDAARDRNEKLEPPFTRLVLYIDDLDRCSHQKVIDVLQAVHMLLAFPLFAVFVAVDVRWLSQALVTQYGGLLASDGSGGKVSLAAPHDYLEKIFQLPYWIEEINRQSGVDLVKALLPLESEKKRGIDASNLSAGTQPPPGSPQLKSLAFQESHHDLVRLFLPYFVTSPRKALWFVNAFRVLKATSLAREEDDEISHDIAIVMQLALASISPSDFHRWLTILRDNDGLLTLSTIIEQRPPFPAENPRFWGAAIQGAKYAEELGHGIFNAQMLLFYGRRAHRFCFNTPLQIDPLSTGSSVEIKH